MNIEKQSVITIIYTPTLRLRRIVGICIKATTREFPGDDKFLGVDCGSPEIEAYAVEHGWTLVYPPPGGRPPRMGTLLRICLEQVTTDVVWTIEHDAEILKGCRDAVSAMLAEHPKVAGIDCLSVDTHGRMNYPSKHRRRPSPFPGDKRLEFSRPWTSLNCGCWRTEALRGIDWSKVPEFPAADQVISRQLLKQGWQLCIAKEQTCVHYMAGARTQLKKAQAATEEIAPNAPYPTEWPYKPPRSFRKRLFSRIPRANFYHDSGRLLTVYDQMLFRPLARLARKEAWITRPAYYWDVAGEARKSVSHADLAADGAFLIQRGFVPEGKPFPRSMDRPGAAPLCFVVPAYKSASTVGRALDSIRPQRGRWECLVSVDGADHETAAAVYAAVDGDPRVRTVVRRKHLLAAGNVLASIRRVNEHQVVCFVDADDYLLREDVAEELLALYADPDVEIVCGTEAATTIGGDSPEGKQVTKLRAKIEHYRGRLRMEGHPDDLARWARIIEKTQERLEALGHAGA